MTYEIRQVEDVTVLDLSGRISLNEALAFGPGPDKPVVLHDLVRDTVKKGSRKILLNLREVSYVDSSGLGELVSCHSSARNQGGVLLISDASPRVKDLLNMTHLSAVLNVEPDEAAALVTFSKPQAGTAA